MNDSCAGLGRPRRSLVVSLVALAIAISAPSATVAAPVPVSNGSVPVAAPTGAFSMNLYRIGDFVPQATAYWCIGASMAMMLNVIGITDDGSRAAQERYMRAARSRGRGAGASGRAEASVGDLRGAGSAGWARGLVELRAGNYQERVVDRYDAAVRAAAYALRRSERPVGLIVWRGAHAWVMTGFTATADPLLDPEFRVTGLYIQDPWYPRVSSIWGPGKKPNTYLSYQALKSAFLPRTGGRRHAEQAGKFVLVMPIEAARWSRQARTAI